MKRYGVQWNEELDLELDGYWVKHKDAMAEIADLESDKAKLVKFYEAQVAELKEEVEHLKLCLNRG